MFPADSVRQPACGVVRQRLGHAEDHDEGQRGEPGGQVELALREERNNAALDADHPAHEGIHDDEQGKLREILTKTQADRVLIGREHCGPHGRVAVS